MARCGCTPKCNCVMLDGICTEIKVTTIPSEGCVSPTFTYQVNVKTDNQTVFCDGGVLVARLNTMDTNTVDLSGTGTAGNPLQADVILTPDGNVPNPNNINPNPGNLIKEGAPGIYVSCEDVQDCVGSAIDVVVADCLDYDDATNTISLRVCGEPNGLECAPPGDPACPAGGLLVTPSADANNALTFGTDGDLYAPGTAVAAGPCMTSTGAGTPGDPFVFSPQVAPELNGVECIPGQGLAVIPSSQAGNQLTFGGDQRLFVNACPVTNGGDQLLFGNTGPCFEFTGGDCGVPIVATFRISDDPCQGIECLSDGIFVQVDQTDLPATVVQTINIPPMGPFNGNFPGPVGLTVIQPICISITNPSPCRSMVVNGLLGGFIEAGRTSGAFRVVVDVAESGNVAGPWFGVSQTGQHNPNPASRLTTNFTWSGTDLFAGPGQTITECVRMNISNAGDVNQPTNNGRIFGGQIVFSLDARWAR